MMRFLSLTYLLLVLVNGLYANESAFSIENYKKEKNVAKVNSYYLISHYFDLVSEENKKGEKLKEQDRKTLQDNLFERIFRAGNNPDPDINPNRKEYHEKEKNLIRHLAFLGAKVRTSLTDLVKDLDNFILNHVLGDKDKYKTFHQYNSVSEVKKDDNLYTKHLAFIITSFSQGFSEGAALQELAECAVNQPLLKQAILMTKKPEKKGAIAKIHAIAFDGVEDLKKGLPKDDVKDGKGPVTQADRKGDNDAVKGEQVKVEFDPSKIPLPSSDDEGSDSDSREYSKLEQEIDLPSDPEDDEKDQASGEERNVNPPLIGKTAVSSSDKIALKPQPQDQVIAKKGEGEKFATKGRPKQTKRAPSRKLSKIQADLVKKEEDISVIENTQEGTPKKVPVDPSQPHVSLDEILARKKLMSPVKADPKPQDEEHNNQVEVNEDDMKASEERAKREAEEHTKRIEDLLKQKKEEEEKKKAEEAAQREEQRKKREVELKRQEAEKKQKEAEEKKRLEAEKKQKEDERKAESERRAAQAKRLEDERKAEKKTEGQIDFRDVLKKTGSPEKKSSQPPKLPSNITGSWFGGSSSVLPSATANPPLSGSMDPAVLGQMLKKANKEAGNQGKGSPTPKGDQSKESENKQ